MVKLKPGYMRKLLLLLFCPALMFAQQRGIAPVMMNIGNQPTTLYQQSHALIIGISDYTNGWPDLPGVQNDVVAVQGALEKHGFNVVTKINLTKEMMDDAFSEFISQYGQEENARLVIYFAGHGHTVKTSYGDKLGYIVPSNAPNPNNNLPLFQKTAMEMGQIEIYAKRIQSKHAIFIFDACFSGALFAMTRAVPEAISYKISMPVRQFITSGDENETVPDKSIFREQFVQALTTPFSDANGDGYLTGTEMGEFLQNNVVNYSYNNQHPQYGKIRHPSLDKGDVVFVLTGNVPNAGGGRMVNQQQAVAAVPVKQVQMGRAQEIAGYGTIEINSEITGDLYIDGQKLGPINGGTTTPVNNIAIGSHSIEIRGQEYWAYNTNVIKDQTVKLSAKSKLKAAAADAKNYFTDPRDKQRYRIVKIENQTWMAQNLNFVTEEGSYCYEDTNTNCRNYGRLYEWNISTEVCPEGWHLPTIDEWEELLNNLGGHKGTFDEAYTALTTSQSNSMAVQLTGWKDKNGVYDFYMTETMFWSCSNFNTGYAWNTYLDSRNNDVMIINSKKNTALPVRCVMDTE